MITSLDGTISSTNEQTPIQFQKLTMARLIKDQDFFLQCLTEGLLEPTLFEGAMADICRAQCEIFSTSHQFPNADMVHVYFAMQEGDQAARKAKSASEVLSILEQTSSSVTIENLRKFASRRVLQRKVYELARKMNEGQWDEQQIAGELIESATSVFEAPDSLILDERHLDDAHNTMQRNTITTGIHEIDLECGGGIGRKECMCIVAPTGIGKTHLASQMAAKAWQDTTSASETIVFVTCEVDKYTVARRIDANITGLSANEVPYRPEAVARAIKQIKGRLQIVEYAAGDATVASIASLVKVLKAGGQDVKLVIIDYDEEMKQEGGPENLRHSLGKIYTSARKMAHDFNLAAVLVSQTNGPGAGKVVVQETDVAESFGKSKKVEVMLTLSAFGWIYLAKNRTGGRSHVAYPVSVDTARSIIQVLPGSKSYSLHEANSIGSVETLKNQYSQDDNDDEQPRYGYGKPAYKSAKSVQSYIGEEE